MEDLRILDVSDPQQQAEEEPITSEKQVKMNNSDELITRKSGKMGFSRQD